MPQRRASRRQSAVPLRLASAAAGAALCWSLARCAPEAWLTPAAQRPAGAQLLGIGASVGAAEGRRLVARAARGGADPVVEAKAKAQTLTVEAGYSGPVYSGPGSVNDAFVKGLLAMFKEQKKLPMKYAYMMVLDVLDILKTEKSLQRVPVPDGSKVTVIGDLHGQLFDFAYMLENVCGFPSPQNPLLFNGDFVDRGPWSVEVLLTLFAMKLQHPTHVHFNRGNHESEMTNYQYGFSGEVEVKYEKKMMELFSEVFRWLPLATVLQDQIFVVHAGIPGPDPRQWEEWFMKAPDEAAGILSREKQMTLAEIEATNRAVEPNPFECPVVIDFLWGDPKGANGYGPSGRVPQVYTFGPDIAQKFCEANGLKLIIRSHETKSAGFQETQPFCHTVFSAPNYIDKAGNQAAVAVVSNTGGVLKPEYKQFAHQPHPDIPSGAYAPNGPMAPKR